MNAPKKPAPAPTLNNTLIGGILGGLAAGFLLGYWVGHGRAPEAVTIAPGAPAPSQAAMPPAMGGGPSLSEQLERQQRIQALEQTVQREPKNVKAWIQLGNDCFDAGLHQKSIDAYDRALALDPKNPDVLTDQGVMYREIKDFQKAVANFEKAAKLDPKHIQSRLNLGVVYAQDLHQDDKAIQAWSQVLALDPNGPRGQQAKAAIEHLKTHQH
jgi:cytochrome c-type biogenesis protein CcmH/NrfG